MRKDALSDFEKAGRMDLADAYKQEIEVLQKYLPAQLSADEIRDIVKATAAELGIEGGKQNMGKLMGAVMGKVKGVAELTTSYIRSVVAISKVAIFIDDSSPRCRTCLIGISAICTRLVDITKILIYSRGNIIATTKSPHYTPFLSWIFLLFLRFLDNFVNS